MRRNIAPELAGYDRGFRAAGEIRKGNRAAEFPLDRTAHLREDLPDAWDGIWTFGTTN